MDVKTIGPWLDNNEALDAAAEPFRQVTEVAIPDGEVRRALTGEWLGHPVHPALTDLPIGFWTSAFVLDIVGGRRGRPAADLCVGLGVLSVLPTAAAGLADYRNLDRRKQRSGVVHAAANVTATLLYVASFKARRRGERYRGVVLGMLGAAVATLGGYLGGHLAYGSSDEPERRMDEPELWDAASRSDAVPAGGVPTGPRSGLVDGPRQH